MARSGGWRGDERSAQEREVAGGAGGGRGASNIGMAAGGGAAAAEEGMATHASNGDVGAHSGKGAPLAAVTEAEPTGSATQRATTASPTEGAAGSESVAKAAIKGHAAVNRGAPSGAPLGARGAPAESCGVAQPSARSRHETRGGVVVGEDAGGGLKHTSTVTVTVDASTFMLYPLTTPFCEPV